MSQFRKKPVVIEAVQYISGPLVDIQTLPGWLIDAEENGTVVYDEDERTLTVRTLEGVHLVSPHDWIIRGVKGELYPCKPDIFALTYEPADSTTLAAGRASEDAEWKAAVGLARTEREVVNVRVLAEIGRLVQVAQAHPDAPERKLFAVAAGAVSATPPSCPKCATKASSVADAIAFLNGGATPGGSERG